MRSKVSVAGIELSACHAAGAHLVHPPLIIILRRLVLPVVLGDLDAPVRLSDVRFKERPFRISVRPDPGALLPPPVRARCE